MPTLLSRPAVDSAPARRIAASRVDDVRIFRIDLALEAVAALDDEPVLIHDAVSTPRPGRAAEREVVLRAAVDVVERPALVAGHIVELRDRQIAT